MITLNSKLHEMYLMKINKKSLSAFDNKRYILNDGLHTIPLCNEKIREYLNCQILLT
jgi:hypothetical protein